MLIPQLIMNGIAQASIFMIMAISVGLVYRVSGFYDFSLGMLFALSSYMYLIFCPLLPAYLAIILAVIVSIIIGCILEIVLYAPIRKFGNNFLILILASLGISIILQNLISICFGDELRSSWSNHIKEGYLLLGARMSTAQMLSIVSAIILTFTFYLIFRSKSIGSVIRAVISDIELARISGVNVRAIQFLAVIFASALAAISGIIVGFDTGIKPVMGTMPFMMGTIVLLIGGKRPIGGCVLGALFLAFSQQLSVLFFGGQWKDSIAFALLLTILLVSQKYLTGYKSLLSK